MQLKTLYEAECVSNRLFNNESAFRDNIIQVCHISIKSFKDKYWPPSLYTKLYYMANNL